VRKVESDESLVRHVERRHVSAWLEDSLDSERARRALKARHFFSAVRNNVEGLFLGGRTWRRGESDRRWRVGARHEGGVTEAVDGASGGVFEVSPCAEGLLHIGGSLVGTDTLIIAAHFEQLIDSGKI